MYKPYFPYARPVEKAAPDVSIVEPRISKWIRIPLALFGRLYLRAFIGSAKIVVRGENHLLESFQRAFKRESRCIAAFLHPSGAEPQILEWFTMFRLKRLTKKAGVAFAIPPQLRFVNGYEVLRWGGKIARFILPRIGAMPVYHAKIDSASMERIYQALIDGPYPVAIAPEGQVSYFSGVIPRLEAGVARIGFSTMERLREKGKKEKKVEILPIAVHYVFDEKDRRNGKKMEKLLEKIEKYLGIKRVNGQPLGERLARCRNHILRKNQERYGFSLEEKEEKKDIRFEEEVDALIEKCLSRAESILDVKEGEKNIFSRMYRLRQICWDRIFIPGKPTLDAIPRLDRALLDLAAGEAWRASRHLELVDFIWYLRAIPVPSEADPLFKRIEYVQNLWDFTNRTMGGAFGQRRYIYPQKVVINAAPVIDLSDYLPAYSLNRKETIRKAMSDLEKQLRSLGNQNFF
jgi:hypothetical protein